MSNEIAKCPNPECGAECHLIYVPNGRCQERQAFCNCGYAGPEAFSDEEAIRLHNLIAARPEPQGWMEAAAKQIHGFVQLSIANMKRIPQSEILSIIASHAPKAVPDLGKFVNISPVVMEGFPDAHRVTFDVGSQHFDIAPNGCETKEDAEWMRDMFLRALSNVAAPPEAPKAVPQEPIAWLCRVLDGRLLNEQFPTEEAARKVHAPPYSVVFPVYAAPPEGMGDGK